jgi:hypothetical protein
MVEAEMENVVHGKTWQTTMIYLNAIVIQRPGGDTQ